VPKHVDDSDELHTDIVFSWLGDLRDGLVYVYNEKIEIAINVAFTTGRPMLIRVRQVPASLLWRAILPLV
jgi:hypothetical protein